MYPNFITHAGLDQRGSCGLTAAAVATAKGAAAAVEPSPIVCLVCPIGHRVTAVTEAQFGILSGSCATSIRPVRCLANSSLVKRVAEQFCLGEQGCSVPVDAALWNGDGACPESAGKSLAVSLECAPQQCDAVTENWPRETDSVHLQCPVGQQISAVIDAQFGSLAGNCSSGFHATGCVANATEVRAIVSSQCIGKQHCTVPADTKTFVSKCGGVKQLAVEVKCASAEP